MEEKTQGDIQTIKKKSLIKRILKIFLYIFLAFIGLNILVYILLSIPYVQKKAVQYAIGIIKEKVDTEVQIDEVRLSLFNHVNLKGVYIEDRSKDTLIYVRNLDLSLSPLKLLENKLLIKNIDLEDFSANINQQNPESDFNFQFLIDAFASDTTAVDTTSSSLIVNIENINLKNGKLRYDIVSEAITPNEFNASHIHTYDLNGNLQLPSVDITNFKATLTSLSFKEHSGLELKNLKANITSDKTIFFVKNTELSLPKSTLKIVSAQYNLLTGAFSATTDQSSISPTDLLPFMKDLKQLKEEINFQTSLSGKLPALTIDSLTLNYGDKAYLKASASISDYSRYDRADIDLNITSFRIEPEAVTHFARIGDSTFVAPDMLTTLGTIRLQGNLQGRLDGFNVKADAWTKLGALQMVAKASTDTTFQNFSANAKLQTQNFNLGSLLEIPELGRLSGDFVLVASQSQKRALSADIKGRIQNLQYNKENYNNIPFTAYYNSAKMGGWFSGDLPQGKIEAKVDMSQDRNPKIDLDMNIQGLKVDAIYPVEGWKNSMLSMHMKGNVRGIDLKNIQADVVIENFEFSHDSLTFKPGNFTLKAGQSDSARNYIRLNSSLLNAKIDGDYDFMALANEFSNMMSNYMPGLFKKPLRPKPGKNNFDVDVSIQNIEDLAKLLDLPINLSAPVILNGTVNTSDNRLNMSARIPRIKYNDIDINNTDLDIFNTDSVINLTGKSSLLMESGNIYFDLQSAIQSDTIQTNLTAKRNNTDLDVNIALSALANLGLTPKGELITSLQFKPTFLNIGNLALSFMAAKIVNEGRRTSISNFGFMAGRGRVLNKYFGVDGVISDQREDTLNISFFNSNLGYILKAFDIDNISTIANGDIKIANILDNPEMFTDNMKFADIIVFNDTLGTLDIKSTWSESAGAIKLDASLAQNPSIAKSTITGLIYPQQDLLDLKINMDRFSLAWLQPFMPDMLNRVSGSISTGLTATGKIATPDISGWLGVNDAYVGIDYTNVTYHIADTIEISPDKIGFDNLVVEDPHKNKARINASVTHKGFENMRYTLDANLTNFMVLNTAGRTDSLFYGTVFASGTMNIKGSDDGINMDMKIRNSKNSTLNIQIPQTSDADVYKSIVYINTPQEDTIKKIVKKTESSLPLKLNVDLTVTPDILLGIVINPLTGDNMQVKGSGLINFTYDMMSENMRAVGNYVLNDGFVKLKLQNLISMEFKIKDGSKLIFNGDPMQTNFDITAFKRVRADLRTLSSSFENDQYNSPKVLVDCLLGIKGNINKMDLTYDISLPDAGDDVQQRVRTLVSTNEAKVTQFAALIATNSFLSEGGGPAGNFTDGLLTSVATGAIGSVLNSALGKVIGSNWQVGANIESDDGTFDNMDMTVNLSRKFLNDKLEFNTNLGYRTDQTSSNSFIGDLDVAYALTRAIKLKVFNKTNDRFYKQAPTTQGVGIVYTKEAKTVKELFRFFRKRRNRTNQDQTLNSR